jgi:hypothetical protein
MKVAPEYAIEALQVPPSISHIYEKVRSKDKPPFLKPEDELPEAELAPPKKRGRRPRKQPGVEDGSVTAEADVQVPKRTRRRKQAIPTDSFGNVDPDVEVPKKRRGRKKKDAEGGPDGGDSGAEVPRKTTQRNRPAPPEPEYQENANVEDAKRGRPFRTPPPLQDIPEEELANLPPLQKEVLQQLRNGWNRNRNKALGDIRRVNVIGEDLCGMIPSRLSHCP